MLSAALPMLLLWLAGPFAEGPQGASALDQILQSRVEEYHLSKGSFFEALTRIAADFELPMGIEWVRQPSAFRHVEISVKATTVRGVLDSLVKTQPGYTLAVRKGVVHVYRRNLMGDPHNFLNLRIDRFEVHDELGGMASRTLQTLVRRVVAPPKNVVLGAGEGGSYAGPVGERRITLDVRGADVRDILDRMVLASDYKVWVATYTGPADVTRTRFLRTVALWGTRPPPDEEQPVWELLRWAEIGAVVPPSPTGGH